VVFRGLTRASEPRRLSESKYPGLDGDESDLRRVRAHPCPPRCSSRVPDSRCALLRRVRFRNITQRPVSIYARRVGPGESEEWNSSLEVGQSREIGLRASGRTHIFTITAEDGGGRHSFRVHTANGRCRKLGVTIEADTITLQDSEPSMSQIVSETDDATNYLLSWSLPSPTDSRQVVADISRLVQGGHSSTWETELATLVALHERRGRTLASLAEKELTQPATGSSTLYTLRLTGVRTPVLAAPASEHDAQVVYDGPAHSANKLGVEERGIVDIEEERDGWLRYRGDASALRSGFREQADTVEHARECWAGH
jgi:hypothetical protein